MSGFGYMPFFSYHYDQYDAAVHRKGRKSKYNGFGQKRDFLYTADNPFAKAMGADGSADHTNGIGYMYISSYNTNGGERDKAAQGLVKGLV